MKRTIGALLVAATVQLAVLPAAAHDVRAGYLELVQRGPESFDVLWKQPLRGGRRLRIGPVFPDSCRIMGAGRQEVLDNTLLLFTKVECSGGLAGEVLAVSGLAATSADVVVRIEHAGGIIETHILRPAAPSVEIAGSAGLWGRAAGYLRLGFEHILFGWDHLLFVFALMLLVRDRWLLVKTITAFTVGHSLSLALATLGPVSVPAAPLEAAIALSIVFLAGEVVHAARGREFLAARQPWLVSGAFGLLHGLGFASALAQIGLPDVEIPLALLLFNIGVEIGQLAFVGVVLALLALLRKLEAPWPRWAEPLPAYAVGSTASFWFIGRFLTLL